MKILIIPDIHNRITVVERILQHEKPDRVVWTGDWFDNFHDGPDDAAATAKYLARRIDENPNDVFCWGNHDLAYGFPNGVTMCTGYTEDKDDAARQHMHLRHWDRFVFHHWEGKWLCSHAGLTKGNFKGDNASIKEWLAYHEGKAQENCRRGKRHWITDAGVVRGGPSSTGGLIWCDATEFRPIENVSQIFGHTPQKRPWKYDTKRRTGDTPNSENYCIDTHLQHYVSMMNNGFAICAVEDLELEELWKKQKGVDPNTGKMWLTPRMERDAKTLQDHWDAETAKEKAFLAFHQTVRQD